MKNGALNGPDRVDLAVCVDPTHDIAITNTITSPHTNLVLLERELAGWNIAAAVWPVAGSGLLLLVWLTELVDCCDAIT